MTLDRRALSALIWMLVMPYGLAAQARPAAERPLTIQPSAGMRFFSSEVGLGSSASVGLRMDLGISDRVALGLDYVFASPTRKNTDRLANVDALRALVRFDLLRGSTRPYIAGGIGGLRFNFTDAVDYAVSAGTLGVGISKKLGKQLVISVESSGDLYETRVEYYDATGRLLGAGPQRWQRLATISAGIGYRF